jgi:hypothetical protein
LFVGWLVSLLIGWFVFVFFVGCLIGWLARCLRGCSNMVWFCLLL